MTMIPYLPIEVIRHLLLVHAQISCTYDSGDEDILIRRSYPLLRQTCLVCRDWNEIATPLLYRRIVFSSPSSKQYFQQRNAFDRTIIAHPEVSTLIRLIHFPPDDQDAVYDGGVDPIRALEFAQDIGTFSFSRFRGRTELEQAIMKAEESHVMTLEEGQSRTRALRCDVAFAALRLPFLSPLSLLTTLSLTRSTPSVLFTTFISKASPHLTSLTSLSLYGLGTASFDILPTLLQRVGPQLTHLALVADRHPTSPPSIFHLCPHLLTAHFGKINIEPLLELGHPTLEMLMIGEPLPVSQLDPKNALEEDEDVLGYIEDALNGGIEAGLEIYGSGSREGKEQGFLERFPELMEVGRMSINFELQAHRASDLVWEVGGALQDHGLQLIDRWGVRWRADVEWSEEGRA